MSRGNHPILGESHCTRGSLISLPRDEKCVMARVLRSVIHPALASLLKGPCISGLLFWGAEWTMSLLCTKLKKGSPVPRFLPLTCLCLQPSLVLHGLSRWDSLGCLRESGSQPTLSSALSPLLGATWLDVWKCLPSEARHSFFLGCNNHPVHADHMQKGARQCLEIYTKVI